MDWRPDVLGGFEQLPLPLRADDEGAVVATLVRPTAARTTAWGREPHGFAHGVDVLYVHGWSDYFFQVEHALFWTRAGARFHALDLRKYGRSLLPHQTPGYTEDLAVYDEDIRAALTAMATAEATDRHHYNDLDTAFHIAIAEAGGNRLFADMTIAIREAMRLPILRDLERLADDGWATVRRELTVQHQAIYEAIATGQSAQAAELMEEHIRAARQLLA